MHVSFLYYFHCVKSNSNNKKISAIRNKRIFARLLFYYSFRLILKLSLDWKWCLSKIRFKMKSFWKKSYDKTYEEASQREINSYSPSDVNIPLYVLWSVLRAMNPTGKYFNCYEDRTVGKTLLKRGKHLKVPTRLLIFGSKIFINNFVSPKKVKNTFLKPTFE